MSTYRFLLLSIRTGNMVRLWREKFRRRCKIGYDVKNKIINVGLPRAK